MIRRVTAAVLALAAAAGVVVIVVRRYPHPAQDSGPAGVLMMTAIVALVASGVIAVRRLVGRRTDLPRVALACLAGLIMFLAITPYGCDDIGGVPDWERCRSFLGNPTLEWRGGSWTPWKILYPTLAPLVLSTAAGVLAWWLVGPRPADRREDRAGGSGSH